MGEPPLLAGSENEMVTCAFPAVAETPVGGPGAAVAVPVVDINVAERLPIVSVVTTVIPTPAALVWRTLTVCILLTVPGALVNAPRLIEYSPFTIEIGAGAFMPVI